jgi:hypothetical protein
MQGGGGGLDPLSPLQLGSRFSRCISDNGVQKEHIRGVLGDLQPGWVSHIQYADDTAIVIVGLSNIFST